MLSALIYLFYGLVALTVFFVTRKAHARDKSVVLKWFASAFLWIFISMLAYFSVIMLYRDDPGSLAYGMILGRVPLYVGLAYLSRVWSTLYKVPISPKTMFYLVLSVGALFAYAHATYWLGQPIVEAGIVAWNIPLPNKLIFILLFFVSFVMSGLVFLLESLHGKPGSKLRPALIGLGLLLVGFGGAQISAETISKAITFQLFTAVGAAMFGWGILKKKK